MQVPIAVTALSEMAAQPPFMRPGTAPIAPHVAAPTACERPVLHTHAPGALPVVQFDTTAADDNLHPFIGRSVLHPSDNTKGVVTGRRGDWFRVVYQDGDRDDVSFENILQMIVLAESKMTLADDAQRYQHLYQVPWQRSPALPNGL